MIEVHILIYVARTFHYTFALINMQPWIQYTSVFLLKEKKREMWREKKPDDLHLASKNIETHSMLDFFFPPP